CNRRSIQDGLTPCYSYSSYGTNPNNWPVAWTNNHTNVSCSWTANGYRLPTEMEWMFAAKGGTGSQGYTYSGSNTVGNVAWYSVNSAAHTWDVGLKAANELGLHDMSGNVWEWCWDIYGDYPSGSQNNPTGAVAGSARVRRGGSWQHGSGNSTVSGRGSYVATGSVNSIGFRVCRIAP
ncbi:MAG: SUMF1/EgtB/PvdO family nonheme iron enzyme, partial [Candidatus Cloacimonas sp.]|nr:SUMF1/EgtB/PvdO family nonheme iron enzyme [Candidatus Cloacimonas sp.]